MFLTTHCRHIVFIRGDIGRIEQSRVGKRGLNLSFSIEMGDELPECLDGADRYILYKSRFHHV